MQFCPSCGASLAAGVAGGAVPAQPVQAPPAQPVQAPPAQPYQTAQPQQPYQTPPAQPYQQNQPGPATTPASDAEENKGMAIIAYILFFVPLIVGTHKTSPFVKYHTNQGLILFIFAVAWLVVLTILQTILAMVFLSTFLWAIWGVVTMVIGLLYFIPLVFVILGIVNVVGGKTVPLPLIGELFTIIK